MRNANPPAVPRTLIIRQHEIRMKNNLRAAAKNRASRAWQWRPWPPCSWQWSPCAWQWPPHCAAAAHA
ncbi:MAG: hypothetical protein OD918_06640 [Gammaproteobacteria bacterium]